MNANRMSGVLGAFRKGSAPTTKSALGQCALVAAIALGFASWPLHEIGHAWMPWMIGFSALLAGAAIALDRSLIAAFLATLPLATIFVPACALIAYFANDTGSEAFAVGTALAVPVWLLLAFAFRMRGTDIAHVSSSNFESLRARVTELRACLDGCTTTSSERSQVQRTALDEARQEICQLSAELRLPAPAECTQKVDKRVPSNDVTDLRWLWGTGYSGLWARAHRAEEALIMLQPLSDVVRIAYLDQQRLDGSTISNRDQLARNLRRAVAELDADAASQYFNVMGTPAAQHSTRHHGGPPPGTATLEGSQNGGGATRAASAQGASKSATATLAPPTGAGYTNGAGPGGGPPDADQNVPRAIIRETRRAINEFRDARFDGLLNTRNRLYVTGIVTGVVTFLLLGFAVVYPLPSGADNRTVIAAAVTFYVVGALAGLFGRLSQAENQSAVEDYGLNTMRLLYTPLFSGIAALAGVYLVAILGAFMPTATNGAGTAASTATLPTLDKIFSLENGQVAVLVAVTFGLTPSLAIDRLRQQARHYKHDIESSEVATSATA